MKRLIAEPKELISTQKLTVVDMTTSKKGIIVNVNSQRTVLRVFCPYCKSECNVKAHEFCKCDVIIECEKCGFKECQCVFHLLQDKQFKERVKTEKAIGREALKEIYLTTPKSRRIDEGTLC